MTAQMSVLCSICLTVVVSVSVTKAGPQAKTKYGIIEGLYSNLTRNFYGIPFASPPVNDLRWQPPVEPKSWGSSVYDGTLLKPGCPQAFCDLMNPAMVCPNKTSEDCLYLNIYTPLASNSSSNLPVMVFIHGGNFVHMSASSLLFHGDIFVNKSGIILVTIDYRMGALGFLVTGKESYDAKGNYGFMDQRMALKWVQENIAAFGGNPQQVTLFGQSAGAQSTILHLMSEKSSPYFQRTIIESSPFTIPLKKFAEAIVLSDYFAELLNCGEGDIACLRTKTAEDIAQAQFKSRSKISSLKLLEMFEPWGPWVDGDEIKMEPVEAFEKGKFSSKPMIIGTTSEETRIYIYEAWPKRVETAEYALVVAGVSPAHVVEILYEYPPDDPTDQRDNMATLATDFVFICSTRYVTREALKKNSTDIWLYLYDHAFSFPGWEPHFNFCQGHVCHGSDMPLVFQSATYAGFNYTKDELNLSDDMITYFTNFAKSGDPNSPRTPNKREIMNWPSYNSATTWPLMRFMTPSSKIDRDFNKPYCNFWDKIGYRA